MILFDLKCGQDHVFEAWFKDGAACESQQKRGEIACPVCGGTDVAKAPMAPRLKKSRQGATDPHSNAETAATARRMLGELRRHVEQNCDYVGSTFAEEARKIHYGETEQRNIYGEATDDEAVALDDEGVPHQRVPWIERTDS